MVIDEVILAGVMILAAVVLMVLAIANLWGK